MGTIETLRELERAATPWPWAASTGRVYNTTPVALTAIIGSKSEQEDAALIAAMRNTLPALLAVVEAARTLTEVCQEESRAEWQACDAVRAALAQLDAVKL